jgi:hypothetical protein
MKIDPTIINVTATRDLKFLEINAGRCPVTGQIRHEVTVESNNVIHHYLEPQIIQAVYNLWPETKECEIPEAFQIRWKWID